MHGLTLYSEMLSLASSNSQLRPVTCKKIYNYSKGILKLQIKRANRLNQNIREKNPMSHNISPITYQKAPPTVYTL